MDQLQTDGFGDSSPRTLPAPARKQRDPIMLRLDAIERSPITLQPFSYFTTKGVLDSQWIERINGDFPVIDRPGVFPLSELSFGPAFAKLISEIDSLELEAVMERKFGVDLSDKPLMITVRGHCQRKDGRIHTDSKDKIVTCLLYLNDTWQESGGRLRLLRDGHDLDSVIAEVPPDGGTLVAFKRADNSWHGHAPFEGPRRYVMFNWVRSQATLNKNLFRHKLSARLKRLGVSAGY